jgi:hypothetical protein
LEPTHRNAGPASLGEPSSSNRVATFTREPFHASPGTPGFLPCIGIALAQLEAREPVGWPRKRSANRRAKLSEHSSDDRGLRERLSAAGEEAFEEVTQALLDNPLLNQALASALGAGERALAAQKSAMSALNIPSADDFERLERRLRSISNRLDDLEDRLDEMSDDVVALRGHRGGASQDR